MLEPQEDDILYDVVIIGCGINGIFCLEYFKRNGLDCLLLDENDTPLSFLNNYMIDDLIFISGGDKLGTGRGEMSVGFLKKHFKEKLESLKGHISYSQKVEKIKKENDLVYVVTELIKYKCKNVVLATGRGIPKKFNQFSNVTRGISLFDNKRILLVGSGDSSADFIFYNYHNNKIYWVNKYDDPQQKLHKSMRAKYSRINKKNIQILDSKHVIDLKDGKINFNGNIIEYDVCACLIGFDLDIEFLNNSNIETVVVNNMVYLKTNSNYETSIENVFGIGEIVLSPLSKTSRAYIEHTPTILNSIIKKIK
tara:strand:- start:3 stop:929 length:927 start_codon:yes stop_codon:yes gene_type:complete